MDRQAGIDALWTYATDPGASAAVKHLVLPDGCMDLIWQETPTGSVTERRGELFVAGPSIASHQVDVAPGARFVGIRFAPGWGGTCLGLDAVALAGQVVPAIACGRELRDIAGVLAAEAAPGAAAALLGFARAKTASAFVEPRILEAIRLYRISGGRIGATDVASTMGSSMRTVRRELLATVGLAPKSMARVFRFRRSLRLRKEDRSLSLAALAVEAGYADQAHMTREYRALGGFTPGRFPPLLVS